MKVTFLEINNDITFNECKKYMELLPKDRQGKCNRYVQDEKKITSILSSLLIQKKVLEYIAGKRRINIKKDMNELTYGYNKYGKPYIREFEEIKFSISHSNNVIVYVQDEDEIGIDVEKVKHFNEKIANKYFREKEKEFFENSTNKDIGGYQIWTMKEAYLKKIGTGFMEGGLKIDVLEHDICKSIISTRVEKYIISVASNREVEALEIDKYDARELLKEFEKSIAI